MSPPVDNGSDRVMPMSRPSRRSLDLLVLVAPLAVTGVLVVGIGRGFGAVGLAVGGYGLVLTVVAAAVLVRQWRRDVG